MKIVYWGTYDLGKPRNRILLTGIRMHEVEVVECHQEVWRGVNDKSTIRGWKSKVLFLWNWLRSYPGLIYRYLRLEKHDAVVIGYLGHLDVLVLWLFARLRGVPIIWDAFLSLYDTVVLDRRLLNRWNPLAFIIFSWEWLACRAADRIVLDTRAHADFFQRFYRLPENKVTVAFVGAEPDFFLQAENNEKGVDQKNATFRVLFYGQFIPLHGIETILAAARELRHDPVTFMVIGQGQEEQKIRTSLAQEPLENFQWVRWVEYPELISWIRNADLCLGIFGKSGKASRVIPNKLFQVVAAGKPIVTMDSPAIRELFPSQSSQVGLVRAGDAIDLAAKIREMMRSPDIGTGSYPEAVRAMINPEAIGGKLRNIIADTIAGTQ